MTNHEVLRSRGVLGVCCSLVLLGCGVGSEERAPFEVGVTVGALDIENVASSYSAWSGKSGGQKTTLSRAASDGDYLAGFDISEKSDDPCELIAKFDTIDTSANNSTEVFDRCDGSGGNTLGARVSDSYRTTGVAVCLNANKMKGFALIGRYPECILDPNGTTPTGAPCNGAGPRYDGVEERTNCPGAENGIDADWEDEAECPVGQVVTGIQLNHVAGGGNRRMINGARAICHPLLP
jgi:hypothetical protein